MRRFARLVWRRRSSICSWMSGEIGRRERGRMSRAAESSFVRERKRFEKDSAFIKVYNELPVEMSLRSDLVRRRTERSSVRQRMEEGGKDLGSVWDSRALSESDFTFVLSEYG